MTTDRWAYYFPIRLVEKNAAMSRASELQHKIAVKTSLAEKHERLAAVAGSKVKKSTWNFHARRFRNQALALQQQLKFLDNG